MSSPSAFPYYFYNNSIVSPFIIFIPSHLVPENSSSHSLPPPCSLEKEQPSDPPQFTFPASFIFHSAHSILFLHHPKPPFDSPPLGPTNTSTQIDEAVEAEGKRNGNPLKQPRLKGRGKGGLTQVRPMIEE
jgi:hypothetical protein